MNIELPDDGDIRTDKFSDSLEDGSFTVIDALSHHGAVQLQQHAIKWPGLFHQLENLIQQRIKICT